MKKFFTIYLFLLSYFAVHSQTSMSKIDTVPAILIICDSSIYNGVRNTTYEPYNGFVPYKYSAINKQLIRIDGFVVQEMGYYIEENSNNITYSNITYKYMDMDLKTLNSKWVYKWKTKN